MNVRRTNRSLAGLGCSCQNPTFGMAGMGQVGDVTTMSWGDPSQTSASGIFGSGNSVVNPGTTANALANGLPDNTTPTAAAVVQSFSNQTGGAQPGVLPLYPNATADNLSLVQPATPSAACQASSFVNSNPWLVIAGVGILFYLSAHHHTKGRR